MSAAHVKAHGHEWRRDHGRPERQWRLAREADYFHLTTGSGEQRFSAGDVEQLRPVRRWFRPALEVPTAQGRLRLRGLSRTRARELDIAISSFLARAQAAEPLLKAVEWKLLVHSTVAVAEANSRWVPQESVDELMAARPTVDPRTRFEGPEAVLFAESLSDEEKAALTLMHQDLPALVSEVNEAVLATEQRRRREFFESSAVGPHRRG